MDKSTQDALIEIARNGLKKISYDDIIEFTKKEFPQLASKAIQGDKFAMLELSNNISMKGNLLDCDWEQKLVYCSISVFWSDKAEHDKGFKCPQCGSNNTITAFADIPEYKVPKGDSLCRTCKYKWMHIF